MAHRGKVFAVVLGLALATGCATYKQDLERAQGHYDANRYENALALFRVLEADLDSLEPADQTRYAYLRGMTDYRQSSIAPKGSAMKDPRAEFRAHARHWLAVAAAMEKQAPGGLQDEEKTRLEEALGELNAEVYGGGEASAGGGDGAKDDAGKGANDKDAPEKPSTKGTSEKASPSASPKDEAIGPK